MGTDVVELQVRGVEASFGFRLVKLVVGDAGVPHDEGVHPQVKGFVGGGVLRGEGVDEELEVRLCVGIGFVKTEPGTEELCRVDGDFSLQYRENVYLHRHTGGTDHLFLLLVVDHEVVEDKPARKSQVHTSDAHLGAQEVTGNARHLVAEETLSDGQSGDTESNHIQCDDCPEDDAENPLKYSHSVAANS